jgi:hypothetical protein
LLKLRSGLRFDPDGAKVHSHPVAEAGEWYPMLVDLPPRGSLLVWLDNFLANPVTEQERTLGGGETCSGAGRQASRSSGSFTTMPA